jgi:transposase
LAQDDARCFKNEVSAAQRVCPACGAAMTTVGFSCCEMLDIIPARIIVVQRKDETVACPKDGTIVSAAPPAQIIERGNWATRCSVVVADQVVQEWPQARLRELLPDRMLARHPELFIGDDDALALPMPHE